MVPITPDGEYVQAISSRGLKELVDWFRTDGKGYGVTGDMEGWAPCETALHFLKRFKRDQDLKMLQETATRLDREASAARQALQEAQREAGVL